MKKILILGIEGMLGSAVKLELEKNSNMEVIGTARTNSGDLYFDSQSTDLAMLPNDIDYVINCIALIRQKSNDPGALYDINSWFPKALQQYYANTNVRIIHPTTDCVFDGIDGGYSESAPHSPTDAYGKSKSLGELPEVMNIRTSIIGLETKGQSSSLMEWFLKTQNKEVFGYTNHIWNGITTNQFGKCVNQIIQDDLYETGIHHIYSTTISKYDLLKTIKKVYELKTEVVEFEPEQSIDRTLTTNSPLCAGLNIPSIERQIKCIKNDC